MFKRVGVMCALALALGLAGCGTTGGYGNYVQAGTEAQRKLAGEAVEELATLWPPAKTRWEMKQATPDAFGTALVKGLRDRGYAIVEFNPPAQAPHAAPAPTRAAVLPLRYVLDHAGDGHLYRLILMVGTQSLTRAYVEQDGSLMPAGYWMRKE